MAPKKGSKRPPRIRTNLTEKEIKFVAAYRGNATAAAREAGYKDCNSIATTLLSRPVIKAALERKQNATLDALGAEIGRSLAVTVSNVLKETARLAFSDPRKLFHPDGRLRHVTELDDDTAATVAGLDVAEEYSGRGETRELSATIRKYKFADKVRSLELLMKYLGMLVDRKVELPPGFLDHPIEEQEYYIQHGRYLPEQTGAGLPALPGVEG